MKVYCSQCVHYRTELSQLCTPLRVIHECRCPENMAGRDTWLSHEVVSNHGPQEKNAKNNCPWFEVNVIDVISRGTDGQDTAGQNPEPENASHSKIIS